MRVCNREFWHEKQGDPVTADYESPASHATVPAVLRGVHRQALAKPGRLAPSPMRRGAQRYAAMPLCRYASEGNPKRRRR
jgi:hypothetical protein